MARVTVEDCIDKVENRFDLVLLASHRARMVSSGAQITIDRDNDKNPVVALREIADTAISPGRPQGRTDPRPAEIRRGRRARARVGAADRRAGAGVDADDTEVTADRMTEEELLKGLEGLAPPEEPARAGSRTRTTEREVLAFCDAFGGPASTGPFCRRSARRRRGLVPLDHCVRERCFMPMIS